MFFTHPGIIDYDELWFPTSTKGSVKSLYVDWARCTEGIVINGRPLGDLHTEAGIKLEDSPSAEALKEYVQKIIGPYILAELPEEAAPDAEVTGYRELIGKYKLEALYQLNYPDFKAAILTRTDLTVDEQLSILSHENSRQLTLLNEQFPECEENTNIRKHLRALNQVTHHLFQAAAFDQPGAVLSARAEEQNFHQMISGRGYNITTKEGILNFKTEATIEKLIEKEREEVEIPIPTAKDTSPLPFIKVKSHYQLTVNQDRASFHSIKHTLEINSPHAKSFRQLSSVEQAGRDISLYQRELAKQVAQRDRAVELHIDPLVPVIVAPMPKAEKTLKQTKIAVLLATKAFIGKEIPLKTLCQILVAHPGWNKGYSSKTLTLVKSALSALAVDETELKQTMMEVKLDTAIGKLELELRQDLSLPKGQLMQKSQLLTVLTATKDYFKGQCSSEELQEVLDSQTQWNNDKESPACRLVQQVLEDKPLNPPSPTSP